MFVCVLSFVWWALVRHVSTLEFVMIKPPVLKGHAVMCRFWARCFCWVVVVMLVYGTPTVFAAPFHLHARQQQQQQQQQRQQGDGDGDGTENTENVAQNNENNVLIGVLSAAAAVLALVGVILLIYLPSKRLVRIPRVEKMPELYNTTRTTSKITTTYSSRSSSEFFNRSVVGPNISSQTNSTVSNNISGYVTVSDSNSDSDSDVDDGEMDCTSSIYSQSEAEFALGKYIGRLIPRPPSSVQASSRCYSCYSSRHSAAPLAASTLPSPFPRESSHWSRIAHYSKYKNEKKSTASRLFQPVNQHKPFSWFRLSTSTSSIATSTPRTINTTHSIFGKPPGAGPREWPRVPSPESSHGLATRRGQPRLQQIRVPKK